MARHSTSLVNGTESLFEVRSESSSGVHTLLSTLKPTECYKLVRGSSDTYLQHWVVVGDSPVVNFSSDELVDNEKITIVWNDTEKKYKKVTDLRYSSSRPRNMPNEQRPQQLGIAPPTPNTGKPPSGIRRFFSFEGFSFPRRSLPQTFSASPDSPSPDAATTLQSANSAPTPDSGVSLITPVSSRRSNSSST